MWKYKCKSFKLIKATLKSKWNMSALSSPPNGILRKNECKTAPHWSHLANLCTFQSLTWCPCAPTRAVASCSWQWTGGHIRCRQRASPPGGIACVAPVKLRAGTPVWEKYENIRSQRDPKKIVTFDWRGRNEWEEWGEWGLVGTRVFFWRWMELIYGDNVNERIQTFNLKSPSCIECTWMAVAFGSCAATCGSPGCTSPQTVSCRCHRSKASGHGVSPWKKQLL